MPGRLCVACRRTGRHAFSFSMLATERALTPAGAHAAPHTPRCAGASRSPSKRTTTWRRRCWWAWPLRERQRLCAHALARTAGKTRACAHSRSRRALKCAGARKRTGARASEALLSGSEALLSRTHNTANHPHGWHMTRAHTHTRACFCARPDVRLTHTHTGECCLCRRHFGHCLRPRLLQDASRTRCEKD